MTIRTAALLLGICLLGLDCRTRDASTADGGADSTPVATRGRLGGARDATNTPLVIRILDVGQGDATLIENGASRVLIDGGPDESRMGELLDSLHLNNTTFDLVVLTHLHADHLMGLRALFESRRNIKVRFFFENKDPYAAANLRYLRDSINTRIKRDGLVYRDADDPCANNQPICNITMKGGAVLHIMRPMPGNRNPNNRSVPVKLVSRDSSFSMWIAGDAEQQEIDWFLGDAHYDRNPGMHVDVLKADHHGSCNGVTDEYLRTVAPAWVTASVGAVNSYHHMHVQAKAEYRARGIPWYRTDQNGTITITAPGGRGAKYSIEPQRPGKSLSGPSDKQSTQAECNPIP